MVLPPGSAEGKASPAMQTAESLTAQLGLGQPRTSSWQGDESKLTKTHVAPRNAYPRLLVASLQHLAPDLGLSRKVESCPPMVALERQKSAQSTHSSEPQQNVAEAESGWSRHGGVAARHLHRLGIGIGGLLIVIGSVPVSASTTPRIASGGPPAAVSAPFSGRPSGIRDGRSGKGVNQETCGTARR